MIYLLLFRRHRFQAKVFFGRENLLLVGAFLSFCYSMAHTFLINLSFTDEVIKGEFSAFGNNLLHLVFTLVMLLNLNTIRVLYRFIQTPRKLSLKFIYVLTIVSWFFYLLLSGNLISSVPLFTSYFHAYFQQGSGTMMTIASVFSIGLSLLFILYYRQLKIICLSYFIVPSLLFFSFQSMLPFVFSILGWLGFCGCQLLLYFSIRDTSLYKNKRLGSSEKLDDHAGIDLPWLSISH
jgi:hypothetical protein